MTIVSRLIAGCFLKGESYLHLFYDDVTRDMLRFEVKGDTKCRLELKIVNPEEDDTIDTTIKKELGEDIIILNTKETWKMIEEDGKLRPPSSLKISLNWVI